MGTAGKCFRHRYGGGVVVYRFLQSIRFTGAVNKIVIIIIKRSPQTVFTYVIVPLVVRGVVVPANRCIIVPAKHLLPYAHQWGKYLPYLLIICL